MNAFVLSAARPTVPVDRCRTCSLRLLTSDDVADAHVLEVMAGKELGDGYRVYSPGQLEEILAEGLSVGVFSHHRLIALRLMRKALPLRGPVAELLEDVPWREGRLCYLPGSFVHPDYRRRGLSTVTTTMALEQARERGMDWCYATVSPGNPASIRNLENLGFQIKGRCRLYNDSPRYVVARPPAAFLPVDSQGRG